MDETNNTARAFRDRRRSWKADREELVIEASGFKCPTCKVSPSSPCVTVKGSKPGTPTETHEPRLELARKAKV